MNLSKQENNFETYTATVKTFFHNISCEYYIFKYLQGVPELNAKPKRDDSIDHNYHEFFLKNISLTISLKIMSF